MFVLYILLLLPCFVLLIREIEGIPYFKQSTGLQKRRKLFLDCCPMDYFSMNALVLRLAPIHPLGCFATYQIKLR